MSTSDRQRSFTDVTDSTLKETLYKYILAMSRPAAVGSKYTSDAPSRIVTQKKKVSCTAGKQCVQGQIGWPMLLE